MLSFPLFDPKDLPYLIVSHPCSIEKDDDGEYDDKDRRRCTQTNPGEPLRRRFRLPPLSFIYFGLLLRWCCSEISSEVISGDALEIYNGGVGVRF